MPPSVQNKTSFLQFTQRKEPESGGQAEALVGQIQIRQGEHHMQCRVLFSSALAVGLSIAKQALYIAEDMLHLTKAYLLDNYISQAMELCNARIPMDITEAGQEAFGDIVHAVVAVRDGEECVDAEQPRIQEILSYFQKRYQEKYTASRLAAIRVAPNILPALLKEFKDGILFELLSTYDELRLDGLYDELSYVVGEELMEQLNGLIKKRFIIASPINMFFQGLTNYFIDTLTAEDIETNKQLFQLILDDLAASQDQTGG